MAKKSPRFHATNLPCFFDFPDAFDRCIVLLSFASDLTFSALSQKSRKICPETARKHKKKAHDRCRFSTTDRGFFFGALEGTRIPGPLIKRIQGASFVKFQKFEGPLFLSYHRKTRLCTHRIVCIQCNALQPLSSYSGAQKVCKNVQTGKTKPHGQINHRFYGRV